MKVLFVTRGWPTEKNPMIGNYEAVQAKALAKRGVDVTVVSLQRKSFIHVFQKKTIIQNEDNGVKIMSVPVVITEIPKLDMTKNSRLDFWLCQRALLKAYHYYRSQNGDADVIHAHIITFGNFCRLVIERYHIPFVITEHWSEMNLSVLDKSLLRRCEAYNWADKVVCVSNALSESLKEKLGVESLVIHNMVSDSFFDEKESKRKSTNTNIVKFISVGSLLEIKRFDLIIQAFNKCNNLANSQLIIIGSGPEKEKLQRLIEKDGLQNKIMLAGRKMPEEVSKLIGESDCFILTSRRETFGIVYIEAMAKGKPVIATACGGPEDFVNESNGLLISAEDVDATTRAIDYMVEHLDQYDGESIRHFCYENFSEDAISKRIISLYEEVINNKEKHGTSK